MKPPLASRRKWASGTAVATARKDARSARQSRPTLTLKQEKPAARCRTASADMWSGDEMGSVMSVSREGLGGRPPQARQSETPASRAQASTMAASTPARATALAGRTRSTALVTSSKRVKRVPGSALAAAAIARSRSG